MCDRLDCPYLAEETEAKSCPGCGYSTLVYSPEAAGRLLAKRHGAPTMGAVTAAAGATIGPSPVLIVTTNEVAGHRIVAVHGDVFGLTVRARNYFSNMGAQLRTVVGGEVSSYTNLLRDSRNEARDRLRQEARQLGGNAVIAMRFDCNEISGVMTETAAYGTAVTIEMLPDSDA